MRRFHLVLITLFLICIAISPAGAEKNWTIDLADPMPEPGAPWTYESGILRLDAPGEYELTGKTDRLSVVIAAKDVRLVLTDASLFAPDDQPAIRNESGDPLLLYVHGFAELRGGTNAPAIAGDIDIAELGILSVYGSMGAPALLGNLDVAVPGQLTLQGTSQPAVRGDVRLGGQAVISMQGGNESAGALDGNLYVTGEAGISIWATGAGADGVTGNVVIENHTNYQQVSISGRGGGHAIHGTLSMRQGAGTYSTLSLAAPYGGCAVLGDVVLHADDGGIINVNTSGPIRGNVTARGIGMSVNGGIVGDVLVTDGTSISAGGYSGDPGILGNVTAVNASVHASGSGTLPGESGGHAIHGNVVAIGPQAYIHAEGGYAGELPRYGALPEEPPRGGLGIYGSAGVYEGATVMALGGPGCITSPTEPANGGHGGDGIHVPYGGLIIAGGIVHATGGDGAPGYESGGETVPGGNGGRGVYVYENATYTALPGVIPEIRGGGGAARVGSIPKGSDGIGLVVDGRRTGRVLELPASMQRDDMLPANPDLGMEEAPPYGQTPACVTSAPEVPGEGLIQSPPASMGTPYPPLTPAPYSPATPTPPNY